MAARRQRVDATVELILRDPHIAVENRIIEKLKVKARRGITDRSLDHLLQTHTALYIRYRRGGLPLLSQGNRKLPQWRSLSPWMRTQLAALCVGELPHLQFRLHLHEELRQQLERGGQDLKVYLRDRLTRTLRESFNPVPQYLFVLEDLDVRGKEEVRPHTHGVIELPAIDVAAFEDGRTRARYRRVIQSLGLKTAQKMAGREALKIALKQATGNLERPRYVGGVDQASNVWTRESYNPLFNKEAISYAFKNADSTASSLPLNRLAKSAGLWAEAQRFWELVRKGEEAMPQWS